MSRAAPAFWHGHATHPDALMALALAAAQIDALRAAEPPATVHAGAPATPPASTAPNLGWIYVTDHYGGAADALLADLRLRWPTVAWVGTVGIGVAASGVEYFDEPALVLMLARLPAGSFTLYHGAQALQALRGHVATGAVGASRASLATRSTGTDAAAPIPQVALVHADPATPDLGELIHELAQRTATGYLFGGLTASRTRSVQFCAAPGAEGGTGGVYEGGVTGVAFGPEVALISRVTQGCQPIGPARRVTAAEANLVLELDGQRALPLLLADLGIDLDEPRRALPQLRATLVGLSDGADESLSRGGQFGADTRVRHLIGLDPGRQAIAVSDRVEPGMRLAFCHRDVDAARRDLVRICAEIREELSPADDAGKADGADGADGSDPGRRIAGAVYVSCNGRGGAHFGGPSAELEIVRHALGDVPLVGFFAAGEIARHHLYGYTGVLTVFTAPAGLQ